MNPCSAFDEHITSSALRLLDHEEQSALDRHVASCPACREALASRTHVLSLVHPDRSEPETAFWDGFADQVMDGIRSERAPGRVHLLMPSAPAWVPRVAAAVLLIATGIAIGQSGLWSPNTPTPAQPAMHTEAAAVTGTLDVLERSRTLLLDLVNADPSEITPNMDQRRRVAGVLAARSAELHDQLSPGEEARLRALLQDLEVILLQIAHIESGTDIPGIEMIRDGVDRNAVLFKIELESLGRMPAGASAN